MKYLPLLFLFIFAFCKKTEVEVTPEYSFIRLNDGDSLSECVTQEPPCLPARDLSDLSFQVVTDFDFAIADAIVNWMIAFPCDVCGEYTAQEVFERAFGTERLQASVSDEGGFVKFTAVSFYAVPPEVGNYLSFTAGIYFGYHLITEIIPDAGGDIMVTSTPWAGAAGGGYAGIITQPFIHGTYAAQLPDDSEFSGDNYLWNFDNHLINDIGRGEGECFSLCVWHLIVDYGSLTPPLPEFLEAECVGTTNCFIVDSSTCFNSVIEYGNDENSFGFYTDGTNPWSQRIRLPLWLFAPTCPGEEKGYQRSDGTFLKLSERINKTWQMETDYFPDQIHERLRIALSCDNIEITNENAQLTDMPVYRDADYQIDWNDELKTYPFAKATTVLFKKLLSRSVNSNCG